MGEVLKSKERVHHVARILPISLAPLNVLIPQLIDPQVDASTVNFTRSYWLVKDANAHNPWQVMMPGGNRHDEDGESSIAAVRRELYEEFALPHGSFESLLVDGGRKYSFPHGSGFRNVQEDLFTGLFPSFIAPRVFSPEDKGEQHPLSLTHEDVQMLFNTEIWRLPTGEELSLVESLRRDPPDSVTIDSDSNREIKSALITVAHREELKIKKAFISHLRRKIGNDGVVEIDPGEEGSAMEIEDGFKTLIQHVRALVDDPERLLTQTLEELYLEYNLRFVEAAGPQKSYLIGQMILNFDTVTAYERDLVVAQDEDITRVLSALANSFGVNFEYDNWHEEMLAKAQVSRDAKVDRKGNYVIKKKEIESGFLHALGISPNEFTELEEIADSFSAYLYSALGDMVPSTISYKLGADLIHTGGNQIDELIYTTLGLDQYKKGGFVDGDLRWQSLRKLITIVKMARLRPLYYGQVKDDGYDIRSSLLELFGNKDREVVKKEGKDMYIGKIQLFDQVHDVWYRYRPKSFESVFRKVLERADEDLSGIKDFFGMEIVVDDKGQEHSSKTSELLRRLGTIIKTLESDNEPITIGNIRGAGDLTEVANDLKRVLGIDLREGEVVSGSAVSNPKWNWIKFVIELRGQPPFEVQIFPTPEDFKKKKEDDSNRYALKRQFTVHRSGRFPLFDVMYRVDEELYETVMQSLQG